MVQTQQGNTKQSGNAENLNNIELPKDSSKDIKNLIDKAKKNQSTLSYQLHDKMLDL
jgi:hypothetical protein